MQCYLGSGSLEVKKHQEISPVIFLFRAEEETRITYDSKVDVLYIRFIETTVTSKHVAEGIAVEYNAEDKIAGIEIMDAVKHFGSKDVFKKVTFEDLALELLNTRNTEQ